MYKGRCLQLFTLFAVITTTTATVSRAGVSTGGPTVIADLTEPVADYILWPIDEWSNFIAFVMDTVLAYTFLPLRYVTTFLLTSIHEIVTMIVLIVTVLTKVVEFIFRFPFVFARDFIIDVYEGIICFPVNGLIMFANILIHAPLNFIGIDVRPYLYYYIVSIHTFSVNIFQGVIRYIFDSVSFLVVDFVLMGLVKWLLELPVWTFYHIIRFPILLLDACLEITSTSLSMLINGSLALFCSLLRVLFYVIIYTVMFIGHWSLQTFLLIMIIAIGIVGWCACAVIVIAVYYSVHLYRNQESVYTLAQIIFDKYNELQNPHIKQILVVLFDMFPKELWITAFEEHSRQRTLLMMEDENMCAVCYESQCFVKLLPCGHNNVCKSCVEEIRRRTNSCPMCRANILMHL